MEGRNRTEYPIEQSQEDKIATAAYERDGTIKPSDLTLAFQAKTIELLEDGELPEELNARVETYDTGEQRTTSELLKLQFLATEKVFDDEQVNAEQGDWAHQVVSSDEAKRYVGEMAKKFSDTLKELINQGGIFNG